MSEPSFSAVAPWEDEGAASRDAADAEALHPSTPHDAPTEALLETIYQAVLRPDQFWRLQHQLLAHFREDRSPDDTPLARAVLRHIQRALRLGARHTALQRERERLLQVVQTVAPPVIVVDDHLQVLGLNRDAEALLGPSLGLWQRDGVLHAHDADALRQLIAQAAQQSYACLRLPGETCAASSPEAPLTPSWLLCAYRNATTPSPEGAASYALLLVDWRAGIQQSMAQLGDRAGLSAREREVLDGAVQGWEPEAIGVRAGITLHTVRQHLKNIYAKTGVHHQNGLFGLVLRNVVLAQAGRGAAAERLPQLTGLAHSRVLRLPDGRQLSYADFGAPTGRPLLYFHALPASRLELLLHAEQLRALGVRVIAMDRPGYGHSSFVERRDYREGVADVRALLDALGLPRVDVLSASAGCAPAVHTGWALPDRVRSVHCTAVVPPIDHILASDSPSRLNSLLNQFFRVVPSLLRPAMELSLSGQTVESLLQMLSSQAGPREGFSFTEEDVAYINAPAHRPYFVASMMESLRQGPRAWAHEAVLINQPWSIDLRELRVPVHVWHGTRDPLVPTDMVTRFVQALPGGRLHLIDDGTHLCVLQHLERLVAVMHAD